MAVHPSVVPNGDVVDGAASLDTISEVTGLPEKAAENALAAFELSPDALILVDARRRVLYANGGAAELTGYDPREIVGQTCSEALGFVTCGRECKLFADGLVCGRHCELRGKGGNPIHVVKNARILRGRDGHIVGGLEVLKDVTELHTLQQAVSNDARRLDHVQALLEAVTDTFDEAIVVIDADGRVAAASPPALTELGITSAHAFGARLSAMFEEDHVAAEVGVVLAEGRSRDVPPQPLRGSPTRIALHLSPLTANDGSILGAVINLCTCSSRCDVVEFHGLVGASKPMRRLARELARLAESDVNVLLTGETGTGKEVAARALHEAGARRGRPFHAINCAALPEHLLESELFGHERGAFTGATHAKPGRFELARDGTLFLDEVGCLPLSLQPKLLRALEAREFERVGGTQTRKLAARIVAATNTDLKAQVDKGTLRADLYYRLCVVPLELPPLRRRAEDVPMLVRHFLRVAHHGGVLTEAAERALCAWSWPGNVRELRNVVDRARALGRSQAIDLCDLPKEIVRTTPALDAEPEGARLARVLAEAQFHHGRAAELLGISRTTLWRRMREHGLI